MTASELRGKIEDFIWDINRFQKENNNPETDNLCDNIVSDLNALHDILRKQEEREDRE